MDPEEPTPELKKAEPEAPLPPPPTPEQEREVERLLQQASLAKIRGQADLAEKLAKEATEVAPGSAPAWEALGDFLGGAGRWGAAKAAYTTARRLDPVSNTIEAKFGEALLRTTVYDSGAMSDFEQMASSRNAAILSMVLPGLGQIVTGRTVVGAVMVAMWVIGIALTVPMAGGLFALLGLGGQSAETFNPLSLVTLLIAGIAWFWSYGEAAGHAKRHQAKKVERPKPPVDKKFEL